MIYGVRYFGSQAPISDVTRSREINLSEILIKAREDAGSAAKAEAARLTENAIRKIANPKKPNIVAAPITVAPATPPRPWLKWGLYAIGGLAVYSLAFGRRGA